MKTLIGTIEVQIITKNYTSEEISEIESTLEDVIKNYPNTLSIGENISILNPLAKYDVETDTTEDLEGLTVKIINMIHMIDIETIIFVLEL